MLAVEPRRDYYSAQTETEPGFEYHDHVLPQLPKSWRLLRGPIWTQLMGPNTEHPVQGWKIHVSAIPDSACRILDKVLQVCLPLAVEFKFASDRNVLKYLLRKNTARQTVGKFITIYPQSEEQFKLLLEQLYPLLKDEIGPYVLSDRQYKDANVLFYRYGGIEALPQTDANGSKRLCILNDRFEYIEDIRAPYFALPDFIEDSLHTAPVAKKPDTETSAPRKKILRQRYEVTEAVKYTAAGGVYFATDMETGREVVIKEARPYIELNDSGVDAVSRLKKEHRMLRMLASTAVAAEAYDYFEVWDHSFLVQEKLPGKTLWQYAAANNKIIQSCTSDQIMQSWFASVLTIAIAVFEKFNILHSRNIIFGDLSLNNILIDADTLQLRMIDFEGAIEPGVDQPTNLFTPGYGRDERMDRRMITLDDDFFALGSLLLGLLLPNVTLSDLKPDFNARAFAMLQTDMNLPQAYIDCIMHLHGSGPFDLQWCLQQLRSIDPQQVHGLRLQPHDMAAILRQCELDLPAIWEFNTRVFDAEQEQRPLPGGMEMLNRMSVNHGALGVARIWHLLGGGIPATFSDWLRVHYKPKEHLPGLLHGAGGMAWALQDMGQAELAKKTLQAAARHPTLFHKNSLGYGVAGYGQACLHLWQQQGDEAWLQEALRVADVLCERALPQAVGCSWAAPDGAGTSIGLWEGASGVALFLSYAYCASQDARYLETAEQGLQFDLSQGRQMGDTLGFPRHTIERNSILYPYLAYGSAGVATVALRLHALTGKAEYADVVEKIRAAVGQKYAMSSGFAAGLSGLGYSMLDAWQFLGDDSWHAQACRCAEGLQLFKIERQEGISFPTLWHSKISCDYLEGSAGVALFLHRLRYGGENLNFMLDGLLQQFLAARKMTSRQLQQAHTIDAIA